MPRLESRHGLLRQVAVERTCGRQPRVVPPDAVLVMVSFPIEWRKQPRVDCRGGIPGHRRGTRGLTRAYFDMLTLKAAGYLDIDTGEDRPAGSPARRRRPHRRRRRHHFAARSWTWATWSCCPGC
ncbi:hypothetical protein ACU686_28125 [Yinghuangia aomiensis]